MPIMIGTSTRSRAFAEHRTRIPNGAIICSTGGGASSLDRWQPCNHRHEVVTLKDVFDVTTQTKPDDLALARSLHISDAKGRSKWVNSSIRLREKLNKLKVP